MATVTFNYTTPTGIQSWLCPANVYFIRLRLWAGGGAGSPSGATGGHGGGGGSFAQWSNLLVTPGVTYNLHVGSGGEYGIKKGDSDRGNGHGGFTQFFSAGGSPGVMCLVYPENLRRQSARAYSDTTNCGCAQEGGSSGQGVTFGAGAPDIFYKGGQGVCGVGTDGGGGGSAGGPSGEGVCGLGNLGGVALDSVSGDGGDHGTDGSVPGGGGGGQSTGDPGAGDGAPGRIEISYPDILYAESGAFVISGTAADLRYWHLNAGNGAFAISGTAADLDYGKRLVAASGSFLLTGTPTVNEASSGAFMIAGQDVTFFRTYRPGNWSAGFPLPPIPPGSGGGRGNPSAFPGASLPLGAAR